MRDAERRTKTVWTTEGPVEVDEKTGIRIATKKSSKGEIVASQDEGDGQEAAVDILSYNISNSDAIQLDPNAEESTNQPDN